MKKSIFLFLMTLFFVLPTANASSDWKGLVVEEFDDLARKLGEKSFSAVGDEEMSEEVFLFAFKTGLDGFCIGLESEGMVIPKEIIDLSTKMHREMLQGKKTKIENIQEIGLGCLTAFEKEMVKEGFSQEEVGALMLPIMKLLIKNIELQFGLE